MSQLFINQSENQVELKDNGRLLTAPFDTDIFDDPEFTYSDLIASFMSLPSEPRQLAEFGDDWWVIKADDKEIDSGEPLDNVRFEKADRPLFLGKTTYLEFTRKGDHEENENLMDPTGTSLEWLGGIITDDRFGLLHSLKYLTRTAKKKTGYIAVTPWYVTYSKGKGAKNWQLWVIAEAQKGEVPTWAPSWSEN